MSGSAAAFAAAAARFAGQAGVLLGWTPDTFWTATPAELAAVCAAMGGDAPAVPIVPNELAALMERFPDE